MRAIVENTITVAVTATFAVLWLAYVRADVERSRTERRARKEEELRREVAKAVNEFGRKDVRNGPLPASGRETDAWEICLEDYGPAELLHVFQAKSWRGYSLPEAELRRVRDQLSRRLHESGPVKIGDTVYSSQDGRSFRGSIC